MQIKYFVAGRNVEVEMSFDEMRSKFVQAGECQMLNCGFRIVMPLGIEIQRA